MRKTISSIIVSIFILSSTLLSQDIQDTKSWYTYWGLGYSGISYPSSLPGDVNNIKNMDDVLHVPLNLDVLGFYFHLTPKTIGGIVLNIALDRYSKDEKYGSGQAYNAIQYLYSFSAMHYLGDSFGSGPFARVDAGLAELSTRGSSKSTHYDLGFGLLVGGGWAFHISEAKLLLNINYTYRGIEGEAYNTMGLSVGLLFDI